MPQTQLHFFLHTIVREAETRFSLEASSDAFDIITKNSDEDYDDKKIYVNISEKK